MWYECSAGGTTCNDLLAAVDLVGGVLSPKQIQGRAMVGVEGAKPPEALEILQLTLAKKCKKNMPLWFIYTKLQSCQLY